MTRSIMVIYETAGELGEFKTAFGKIPGVFNFFYAFTVKEGFHLLKRNSIDIVFVKYTMPEVNGLQLLAAVKTFNKFNGVKIYLYEDEITREQSELARMLGASGCIEKKIDATVFVHELRAIINPQLIPNYVFLQNKVSVDFSSMIGPDQKQDTQRVLPQTLESWLSHHNTISG